MDFPRSARVFDLSFQFLILHILIFAFTVLPSVCLIVLLIIIKYWPSFWGTVVAHWLRCYSTMRKVAGSIPDGVIVIFH